MRLFFTYAQWRAIPDKDAFAARVRAAVNDAAITLGGTFGAEHGVGRTLTAEMARYKPAAGLAMMRAVKQALDPNNLFNPGRLLPSA